MRKFPLVPVSLFCIVMLASCHRRNSATTIVINSENVSIKIKYAGHVQFNQDSTTIESISPGGYLEFRKNEQEIVAENNRDGNLTIELYNERKPIALDNAGKEFLAGAVKEMIEHRVGSVTAAIVQ